jgi:tRNA 2-thiouridine synthesizing protein A
MPEPLKYEPVVIDARGHRCPVPTLKLQKQMHATAEDTSVILIADDPMAQIDVPHFCNQNRYLLQSVEPCGTGWRFEVLRKRP